MAIPVDVHYESPKEGFHALLDFCRMLWENSRGVSIQRVSGDEFVVNKGGHEHVVRLVGKDILVEETLFGYDQVGDALGALVTLLNEGSQEEMAELMV